MGCLLYCLPGVGVIALLAWWFVSSARRRGNLLGGQLAALERVNTSALDAGQLARWQSYHAQVQSQSTLLPQQFAEVRSWPTR